MILLDIVIVESFRFSDEGYNENEIFSIVSIIYEVPFWRENIIALQFDWLRAVVFQLNLKYLHVKITNLLRVVV